MKKPSGTDNELVVGGLTPLTTIDYPGELAAVIFLQGCPWRCGYCQNTGLITRDSQDTIAWPELIAWLEKRQGLLDAVVFSGGEPTLQPGLEAAMRQVKAMGFRIGLHTAGIYPDRLRRLLPLLDWVGLDIKAAKADYPQITGVKDSGERAWESAGILLESGVVHEFRTTVHPDMLSKTQISALVDELTALGAEHYVIQQCITKHCLDEARRVTATRIPELAFINQFSDSFSSFSVRQA